MSNHGKQRDSVRFTANVGEARQLTSRHLFVAELKRVVVFGKVKRENPSREILMA